MILDINGKCKRDDFTYNGKCKEKAYEEFGGSCGRLEFLKTPYRDSCFDS